MRLRFRSLLVSLASTALDWGLFFICTLVWTGALTLLLARAVCGSLGALCNFVLNRLWAFRAQESTAWGQVKKYALVATMAVALATGGFWILRLMTGWDARLVHPLSLAVVWLGFTFPMLRRWVFRPG